MCFRLNEAIRRGPSSRGIGALMTPERCLCTSRGRVTWGRRGRTLPAVCKPGGELSPGTKRSGPLVLDLQPLEQ